MPHRPARPRQTSSAPHPRAGRAAGTAALAVVLGSAGTPPAAAGGASPVSEPHHRLVTAAPGHDRDLALTLDACGGRVDQALIDTLVRLRVPATLFVTRRWLERHADTVRQLRQHPDLFELENHGRDHIPAVVGRSVYGLKGPADAAGVQREVSGGSQAVVEATGRPPQWYRGAGAAYDAAGRQVIEQERLRIAGFSLNADGGATLGAAEVARRLRRARPGDIVIAHMNHPEAGTSAGFAAALPELRAQGYTFVRLSQAAGVVEAEAPASLRASVDRGARTARPAAAAAPASGAPR